MMLPRIMIKKKRYTKMGNSEDGTVMLKIISSMMD